MKSVFKFIRILFGNLKQIWIIEIEYPKLYPSGQLRSLIPSNLLKNSYGLFIEEDVQIRNPNIKIGKHTYIGNNTLIDSCSQIGAFCSISSDVKIGMRNHPLNSISTSPIFYSQYRGWLQESCFDERNIKQVMIEDDVLISANVVIVNGIKIGRGAVIGAGAIVTKDVQAYSIVAGVPAKFIRYRFSEEIISKIETSAWWTKEDEILKNFINYTNNPALLVSKLKEW